MRCADCKSWSRYGASTAGNCGSEKLRIASYASLSDGLMVNEHSLDDVVTGENFGCVHFDAKEEG